VLQEYQPPLVKGDWMYVTQPGVRTVDCLAVATGQRCWSVVLPEVTGMVGLAGGLLVIRTEMGLQALDLTDGKTRWRYNADDVYCFPLADEQRLLVACREHAGAEKDRWQVRLTWLEAATGAPTATTILSDLIDVDPRLGPLVPHGNRLFAFFGRGQHDPARDVLELIPKGEAERIPPPQDAWQRRVASAPSP